MTNDTFGTLSPDYKLAHATVITFLVVNPKYNSYTRMAEAWEKEFLDFIRTYIDTKVGVLGVSLCLQVIGKCSYA